MSRILKIRLHYSGMNRPEKAHAADSGLDLTLMRVLKKRTGIFFFDTGISIEPPAGYYAELVPRSSIYKTDFIMANSIGIVDNGYRGPLMMPMRYLGSGDGYTAARGLIGRRVGQLILKRIEPFDIQYVENLSDSERGEHGFGSSGV